MTKKPGYRGYISSRPILNNRVPQHVQNLVIRDYCASNNLHFLLSATEYAMPNCYIMLEQVLKESVDTQGLVLYSLFQLPHNKSARMRIYNTLLERHTELHMAVEGLVVKDEESVQRVEDIWLVYQTMNSGRNSTVINNKPAGSNNAPGFGFGDDFFPGFGDCG